MDVATICTCMQCYLAIIPCICRAQSMDLGNSWIALHNAWIHTMCNNPCTTHSIHGQHRVKGAKYGLMDNPQIGLCKPSICMYISWYKGIPVFHIIVFKHSFKGLLVAHDSILLSPHDILVPQVSCIFPVSIGRRRHTPADMSSTYVHPCTCARKLHKCNPG